MKKQLTQLIEKALKTIPGITLPTEIQIENTRNPEHGDFASNIALALSKSLGMKPRDLAEKIVANLPQDPLIKQATIAGPGFINFHLSEQAFVAVIPTILQAGSDYGRSDAGQGKHIIVEFVSSNPTGPLHVGHGRGAAYGATVCNLLDVAGFKVHREYYVNDAGRQMDIVTVSIWLRYLELFGEHFAFPVNGYKGDYVIAIAQQLKVLHGDKLRRSSTDVFRDLPQDETADGKGDKEIYIDAVIKRTKELLGTTEFKKVFTLGLKSILDDMREDLAEFGVTFQQWYHESTLVENGALQRGVERLREAGHLYEKDGATWFRATEFGDEKDRVVIRENGTPTYFAADIAYHLSKIERKFDQLIDIFGADHHGYAPRIKAFLNAIGEDPEKIKVLLVQFAILYRGKERVQMSTRAGSFVTLRELREEVGNDAARYFYIMRKPEQHLDFDLELAKSQSNDNPVYYIQYAHARVCSVFRQLQVKQLTYNQEQGLQNLHLLRENHEIDLIRALNQFQEIITTAALNHEPHLLAHYLQELANYFHSYYNSHQFLIDDEKLRNARLVLITATRQILVNGTKLLGVSAPEVM